MRAAAAVSAIASAGAGLTLSGISAMTQYGARNGSQRDVASANERSRDLNRASIPAYSAAVLASGVWALTWLWADAPVTVNAAVVPRERGAPGELVIEGRF